MVISFPWWALAQATGINVFVHCFDRFALNADFAQTTLNTWSDNFSHGFVWDNDIFSTNLFMHLYHGNLYYNSARSQGLTFWESAPFAALGSLEWEFLGEREPPALTCCTSTPRATRATPRCSSSILLLSSTSPATGA